MREETILLFLYSQFRVQFIYAVKHLSNDFYQKQSRKDENGIDFYQIEHFIVNVVFVCVCNAQQTLEYWFEYKYRVHSQD